MTKIKVIVEIDWGKRWNGSYYQPTPGKGVYVTVMETERNSFVGCPLGRNSGEESFSDQQAVDYAMHDFIRRGKSEFRGEGALTLDRLEVVRTIDHRRTS